MHRPNANQRIGTAALAGFRSALRTASLCGLLLIAVTPNPAQAAPKQILVLQSLDRGNLVLDQFIGDFRVQLDKQAGEPVDVVQIVVGPTGFVHEYAPGQSPRRRQFAEELAHQAPVKMLLPMIGFIFPSIFIVLLTPTALTIMRTPVFGG